MGTGAQGSGPVRRWGAGARATVGPPPDLGCPWTGRRDRRAGRGCRRSSDPIRDISTDFLPLPRFLLGLDLSPAARWIYALLLARTSLSQRNRWTDAAGRCYVVYPLSELAADAHCARSSVSRALEELAALDLIERHRLALNRANRIFVHRPPDDLLQERLEDEMLRRSVSHAPATTADGASDETPPRPKPRRAPVGPPAGQPSPGHPSAGQSYGERPMSEPWGRATRRSGSYDRARPRRNAWGREPQAMPSDDLWRLPELFPSLNEDTPDAEEPPAPAEEVTAAEPSGEAAGPQEGEGA